MCWVCLVGFCLNIAPQMNTHACIVHLWCNVQAKRSTRTSSGHWPRLQIFQQHGMACMSLLMLGIQEQRKFSLTFPPQNPCESLPSAPSRLSRIIDAVQATRDGWSIPSNTTPCASLFNVISSYAFTLCFINVAALKTYSRLTSWRTAAPKPTGGTIPTGHPQPLERSCFVCYGRRAYPTFLFMLAR